MQKALKLLLSWALILAAIFILTACKSNFDGMLNPKGIIAYEQRKLFFDTLALMLIVVLPVIVMSITFVIHYRVSHRTRDYKPRWSHSHLLESLWWGIPCVIIVVLAIITWIDTHKLDPYRPIKVGNNDPPLLIQVIALPWKWLFIYPQQNIATINYVQIPVGQPVEYWLTTDNVPMSAFFIPQLGSQIYVMSGMRTRLFLLADEPGDFLGVNTLFNGSGFAEMHFIAHAVPQAEMQQWFDSMKKWPSHLTDEAYVKLLNSSVGDPPAIFSGIPNNLFQNVINTYMNSSGTAHPRENQAKFNYLGNQKE